MKKKALLLDVSAMMYRAYFAHMNFRTKGEPTGAIFGFTNTLLAAIDEFSPDYIGAAFDVKRSTLKRSEVYADYKADRKPMPDDLRAQMSRIEDVIDAFGIERYKIDGNEADDVLGTLAKRLSADGIETYILTGDKDLSQVLDENINIALLGKGEGKSRFKILSTDEDVREQLGVNPKDIPDLFGLIGDKSDGIPGVRGVGEKKAIPMLELYKNLEGVYENVDKLIDLPGVGKGLIKKIEEDKELAFLSRELAIIDVDIPLDYSLEVLEANRDNTTLYNLFKELEFRVLIRKLGLKPSEEKLKDNKLTNNKEEKSSPQLGLFGGPNNIEETLITKEQVKEKKKDTLLEASINELRNIISNLGELLVSIEGNLEGKSFDEVIELTNKIKDSKSVIESTANIEIEKVDIKVDVEEDKGIIERDIVVKCLEEFEELRELVKKEGLAAIIYNRIGLAITLRNSNHYIPLNHTCLGAFNITKKEINSLLGEDVRYISYNFKEILRAGYEVKNIHFDAMIAYYLLTAYTKEDVDTLIYNETGEELDTYKDVFGKEKPEMIDVDRAKEYLVKRSKGVYELSSELEERLVDEGLDKLYREVEMPLMPILASMERAGIAIDLDYFSKYGKELIGKLDELQKEIYAISGEEFNLNSPKQLAEVLFIGLNIDTFGVKKTKTGYSTGVEVLELLRDRGEKIAEYILEYRKLSKLSSTYVENLPKLADKEARLHTTFNQTGTATGRLSSSNPNLQNIPVKTEEGIKIRQGFLAKDGYTLLALDYSQIELRVLAEISKDEKLVRAYKAGLDLHDQTARRIFELDETQEVSREQRTTAKIINFSIIYGKTPFGLSNELGITRDEAKEYIARYFMEYPKVKELEEEIVAQAEEKGYVKTLYGRKRTVDGINAKNKNIKSQAERMAVNTVIQGTAADILKKVMIEIAKELVGKDDITLNLQVHDELIFEVRDDRVEYYASKIKNIMETSIEFEEVRLEANVAMGKNWAKAK